MFAEVTSVCTEPHNGSKNDWIKPNQTEYKYYYGHARILGRREKVEALFQLTKHISKPIHIGPMNWHAPPPASFDTVVCVGDIILGQLLRQKEGEKRKRFAWWSCRAGPVYELHRLLRYKGHRKRSSVPRIHRSLLVETKPCMFVCAACGFRMPHVLARNRCEARGGGGPGPGTPILPDASFAQDLWVRYISDKVVYERAVSDTVRPQGHTPVSVTKSEMTISYAPLRFVFVCTWMAGDVCLRPF